jgi:hypothetical protein
LLEHTDGTGGASLLVDGFYAASILRDLHPDAYRLLSTIPIPAHAAGEAGILYRAAHTALEHDAAGNLRAVRWNNDDRSGLRDVTHDDIPRLYEAMRTWDKLITSQDSEYWVQLSPGTVIGTKLLASFISPPVRESPFWHLVLSVADDTTDPLVQRLITTVYFTAALPSRESAACVVRTSEQTSSDRDWRF